MVVCDRFRLRSAGGVGRWSGGVHLRGADQLTVPALEPILRLPLVPLGLEVATKFRDSIYIIHYSHYLKCILLFDY